MSKWTLRLCKTLSYGRGALTYILMPSLHSFIVDGKALTVRRVRWILEGVEGDDP